MDITPTGKIGVEKQREQKIRQAWADIKTKAAWDALTNAQRLEYVRLGLKLLIKNNFPDLIDDGD